jgi:hypothetical protein
MDSVRILGKTWHIKRLADAPMQQERAGEIDYKACTIHVKEGQAPDQEADTLLHEIIHALSYTVSLDLEEAQVHSLSAVLLAVFRDNPGLAGRLGFVPDEP